VVQVLAPGCVPLCLTDGLKEYGTALLTHFGSWSQPERRQATGPRPKPRWMPLPQLLLCAGGEVVPAQTPCESQTPGGLRDDRPGHAGAVGMRLADQYGFCREAQSGPAPAGGCSQPSGQHALQGRGQLGTTSGVVSHIPHLLGWGSTYCPRSILRTHSRTHQWYVVVI
jgi:hypothetical protein